MSLFLKIIPSILSVLDLIPFKGVRTIVCFLGAGTATTLGLLGKLDATVASTLTTALMTGVGYFAAQHNTAVSP